MKDTQPLLKGRFKIQKFKGKGGWSYIDLPTIPPDTDNPFGWRIVRGRIDQYEFTHYKLMPKGDGTLFFAVNKSIRNTIGKKEGDVVELVLYSENTKIEIPDYVIECLKNESDQCFTYFSGLSDSEKKVYVDKIKMAKTDETRAKRIIELIEEMNYKINSL